MHHLKPQEADVDYPLGVYKWISMDASFEMLDTLSFH